MPTYAIASVTSSTNIDPNNDMYLIDASGGNITLTLFDIAADGQVMIFKRTDNSANTVTLVTFDVSENIDGATSYSLPAVTSVNLVSFGDTWYSFN